MAASSALTLGLFFLAELAVRLAGVEPLPWPTLGGERSFDGVRVDPLLGPMPVPGWSGRWFGEFAAVFDQKGFRTTDDYRPPPGPRREIVFLGDSCTFGWGVDTPDTFLALLRDREAAAGGRREFLNASYPGLSAVSGAHVLGERVLPRKPDVVVLAFSANNAFRFALVSDAERFRHFGLRKVLLRARLFHVAAAWLLNRAGARPHPRDLAAVAGERPERLKRVASPEEFETALRTMVAASRSAAARVIFLLFPRASVVSDRYAYEDAARMVRDASLPAGRAASSTGHAEIDLLEVSCLPPGDAAEPAARLGERARGWQPVFPADPGARRILGDGARAYVAGQAAEAAERFEEAVALDPRSPLARYDLGVARLARGDGTGLDDLAEAERLACNVFLSYQVRVWRVAWELAVPVVDLTLVLEGLPDAGSLFLDPAHLNAAGQRVLAEALWSQLGAGPRQAPDSRPGG